MINRELIRLKIVQLVYAHRITGEENIDKMEQELMFSLQKSYDLYHHLLQFLVDLHRVAERQVEAGIQRWNRVHTGEEPSRRFIDGDFIRQLSDNEQLRAYCANQKWGWMDQEQFLLRTYQKVLVSDYYMKYMELPNPTYQDHRDVWYNIYADCVCNSEFIDWLLESESLYWNDDKHFVDSFVLKTIRNSRPTDDATRPLLADFKNDSDREFAHLLLRSAVLGADTYRSVIAAHLQAGWDMERIAQMDSVILQVALAEILNCPDIPLRVSMNEYIEIAKDYSTPQSGAYVNGMLDAMVRTLRSQGQTTKDSTPKP